MGALERTQNIDLPIFGDDDKPTWRGDINGAMRNIDAMAGSAVGTPINALDKKYGVPTDGTTDATTALRNAITATGVTKGNGTSRGLIIPSGVTLYVNDVVDFRYIVDLRLMCKFVIGPNGKIIVGHTSTQRPGQSIRVLSAMYKESSQTNCCIEVRGIKQASMQFDQTDRLDFVADTTDSSKPEDSSIAYNNITLGLVRELRIQGFGNVSWINENIFIGGDIRNLIIDGPYAHNNNVFYKPCFEGGAITIGAGVRNHFIDARCEGATTLSFGANTNRNYFEDNYISNPRTVTPGIVVSSDLGVENVVIGSATRYMQSHELAAVDASKLILDKCADSNVGNVTPGLRNLIAGAWTNVIDTGIFPVRAPTDSTTSLLSEYETRNNLLRFAMMSNVKSFRFGLELWDANMNPIANMASVTMSPGAALSGNVYSASTDAGSFSATIIDANAYYARIKVSAGGSGATFRYVRLNGYTLMPSGASGAEYVRRQMRTPLFQPTKPIKGYAKAGTVVQSAAASFKCSFALDTTLSTSAGIGSNTISVTSATGVVIDDVVGVLLDDWSTLWTTVSAINGTSITLNAVLPTSANATRRVVFNRWV